MKETVYVCDACGMRTESPHSYKFKEFFVGRDMLGLPCRMTRRVKAHICDGCYKSLQVIVQEKHEKKLQEVQCGRV